MFKRLRRVRRYKKVHVRKLFFHITSGFSYEASAENNFEVWILKFEVLEGSDEPGGAIFRVLADDAGVDEDDIRRFFAFRRGVPRGFENFGQLLRIGDVHLATVGFDEIVEH